MKAWPRWRTCSEMPGTGTKPTTRHRPTSNWRGTALTVQAATPSSPTKWVTRATALATGAAPSTASRSRRMAKMNSPKTPPTTWQTATWRWAIVRGPSKHSRRPPRRSLTLTSKRTPSSTTPSSPTSFRSTRLTMRLWPSKPTSNNSPLRLGAMKPTASCCRST